MWRIAIILFVCCPASLNGQIISDWEKDTDIFLYRIKNIEFFINRFNNQNDSIPQKPDPKDSLGYAKFISDRTGSLASLFDRVAIRDKSQKNFRNRAGRFIQWVNDPLHQQYIHFEDSNWYAEVRIISKYLEKAEEILCTLQFNQIPTGGYEWRLLSLRLTSMKLQDKFKDEVVLPPAVHGTDFIGLSTLFKDEAFIKQTVARLGHSNVLPLIESKKLVTGSVGSIRYHFFQLPGWLVRVGYLNRASRNSGWLISELIEVDERERSNHLKQVRGY